MTSADIEILTVEDLARLLCCDAETASSRLISGDLPGVKVGRGWIIPRQALFERLNEKARDEAAARRAEQKGKRQEAQHRGQILSGVQNAITPPAALLPTSAPISRGRKRRQPPPLPTI
ncbi:helix-turn-helix domain-containing protein [Delftia tsuruhatensis]|uniref:helix-turn-helix domain-containing protein n=1 Tax=Delftia tsuruhatensis TaxID=180282 RepID=UPI003D6CE4D2